MLGSLTASCTPGSQAPEVIQWQCEEQKHQSGDQQGERLKANGELTFRVRGKTSQSRPWPTYQEVGLEGSAQVGAQRVELQPWLSV